MVDPSGLDVRIIRGMPETTGALATTTAFMAATAPFLVPNNQDIPAFNTVGRPTAPEVLLNELTSAPSNSIVGILLSGHGSESFQGFYQGPYASESSSAGGLRLNNGIVQLVDSNGQVVPGGEDIGKLLADKLAKGAEVTFYGCATGADGGIAQALKQAIVEKANVTANPTRYENIGGDRPWWDLPKDEKWKPTTY